MESVCADRAHAVLKFSATDAAPAAEAGGPRSDPTMPLKRLQDTAQSDRFALHDVLEDGTLNYHGIAGE